MSEERQEAKKQVGRLHNIRTKLADQKGEDDPDPIELGPGEIDLLGKVVFGAEKTVKAQYNLEGEE